MMTKEQKTAIEEAIRYLTGANNNYTLERALKALLAAKPEEPNPTPEAYELVCKRFEEWGRRARDTLGTDGSPLHGSKELREGVDRKIADLQRKVAYTEAALNDSHEKNCQWWIWASGLVGVEPGQMQFDAMQAEIARMFDRANENEPIRRPERSWQQKVDVSEKLKQLVTEMQAEGGAAAEANRSGGLRRPQEMFERDGSGELAPKRKPLTVKPELAGCEPPRDALGCAKAAPPWKGPEPRTCPVCNAKEGAQRNYVSPPKSQPYPCDNVFHDAPEAEAAILPPDGATERKDGHCVKWDSPEYEALVMRDLCEIQVGESGVPPWLPQLFARAKQLFGGKP